MIDYNKNNRKRQRDSNDDDEDYKTKQKRKTSENFIIINREEYKSINEIKSETINKFNELDECEIMDNDKLFELASNFDLSEEINKKILLNILKAIDNSIKNTNTKNYINNYNSFIKNYNKYRYTISTLERIKILKSFKKIINLNSISDINFIYESKDPKYLLQEFLLNLIKLFNKCINQNGKEIITQKKFRKELSVLIKGEGYQIGDQFFTPSNFGNLNFKFSVLFNEYLKMYDELFFDENKKQNDTEIIRYLFVKKTNVLYLFLKTIENKNEILNDELYLKYLKIIYIILIMCDRQEIKGNILSSIQTINDCMINLIDKDTIKNYVHNNPKKLFIMKKGKEIELTDSIINKMNLNEILIYKGNYTNIDFDIKKYNKKIFDNLEINLKVNSWIFSNFEFIDNYYFINTKNELKLEFKNNLKTIIESPYIKQIYSKIENRFEKNYLFEGSDKIYNEIYDHITFFPFPLDSTYGYCDRNSLDIYINMYEVEENVLNLFGKMYANTNDILHEIFHITPCYYVLNSDNKNIKDVNSRISSKKKEEYVKIQEKFIQDTKSQNQSIKPKEELDFGDILEIEIYGFCIRDFTLKNTCELFLKKTWYNDIENFKGNYIERSIINEDEIEKEVNKISKGNINYKSNKNLNDVNINEYKKQSSIINTFFKIFKLSKKNTILKNQKILVRKRESYMSTKNGIIFSRPLGKSRNALHGYRQFSFKRHFAKKD